MKHEFSKPVYLLIGKEAFLKREFIQDLRRDLFPKETGPSINFQSFDASRDSLSALFEFVQTVPFLGDKKLAVLWGLEAVEEEDRTRLVSQLKNFPLASVLVLVSGEGSAKKSGFLRELSLMAETVACHPPFEKDLPLWLENRAKRGGVRIERDAATLLIEKMGRELGELVTALEELGLYVHPRTVIGVKDIQALFGRSIQADVFALADALLERNLKSSLEILAALKKEGTQAYQVIGVLAGQFERMKQAALFLKEGLSVGQIGEALKVHSFFLEKFMRQARKLSASEIQKILEALLRCDESVKRGFLNETLALESFVLALCAGKNQALSFQGVDL